MATFPEHHANEPGRTPPHGAGRMDEILSGVITGGSATLAIGGIITIVLAIIGLSTNPAGGWPLWMNALCTLVLGAAFVIEGLAVMARNLDIVTKTGGTLEHVETSFGVSPEFLAGCAGVVLGILSLLGVHTYLLASIALIAFGGALLFGATPRVHAGAETMEAVGGHDLGRSLFSRPTSAYVMVGLSAIALGIIAVYGIRRIELTLIGDLCVGSVVMLTGSAIAYRMASRLSHVRERARI